MKRIILLLLFSSALSAHADEPFVGVYQKKHVDSVSQLLLLDKQRFCFALAAGSLDLFTGGSWQKISEQNGKIRLQLKEKRLGLPAVMMVANPTISENTLAQAQQTFGKQQRVVFLTPPALDSAIGSNPAFAFGNKADWPAASAFKSVFVRNSDIEMYAQVPIPKHARYVFVRSEDGGQVFRFAVGGSQYVKLNPNEQAGRMALDFDLVFHIQTRELAHEQYGGTENWGQPEKLPPQVQEDAWAQCEPKIHGEAKKNVSGTERTLLIPDVLPQK